jgi:hypothetical protein
MGKPVESLSVALRVSVVANKVPNGGSLVGMVGEVTGFDGKWILVRLDGENLPVGFLSDELEPA